MASFGFIFPFPPGLFYRLETLCKACLINSYVYSGREGVFHSYGYHEI